MRNTMVIWVFGRMQSQRTSLLSFYHVAMVSRMSSYCDYRSTSYFIFSSQNVIYEGDSFAVGSAEVQ
jgi:hypothetical protein